MVGYTSCECGMLQRRMGQITLSGVRGFPIVHQCRMCGGRIARPISVESSSPLHPEEVRYTYPDGTIIRQTRSGGAVTEHKDKVAATD